SRRRHTSFSRDWSSDVCSSDLGMLGFITAATLRLYPRPAAQCTALLALHSVEAAVAMLALARKGFAASLTAYELIAANCLNGVRSEERRVGKEWISRWAAYH